MCRVIVDRVWIQWTVWYNLWLYFTNHCYTYISVLSHHLHLSYFNSFPFLWIPKLSMCLILSNSQLTHKQTLNNNNNSFYYSCNSSQSQSYLMTDGQSASLSWYQAPIWDLWPLLLSLTYLDSWGFVIMGAASLIRGWAYNFGCCWVYPRSLSRVLVLRDSWPYFTVSILKLLQLRGPVLLIYFPKTRYPSYTPGIACWPVISADQCGWKFFFSLSLLRIAI
jgi:hypothetical protein